VLDHVRRRRQVGIAHTEIDNVGARVARRRLGPIDLLENVRRQAANAVKLFHGLMAPRPFGRPGRRTSYYHGSEHAGEFVRCAIASARARRAPAYLAGSLAVNSAGLASLVFFAGLAAAAFFAGAGAGFSSGSAARCSCCWRRLAISPWVPLISSSVTPPPSPPCHI